MASSSPGGRLGVLQCIHLHWGDKAAYTLIIIILSVRVAESETLEALLFAKVGVPRTPWHIAFPSQPCTGFQVAVTARNVDSTLCNTSTCHAVLRISAKAFRKTTHRWRSTGDCVPELRGWTSKWIVGLPMWVADWLIGWKVALFIYSNGRNLGAQKTGKKKVR